MPTRCDKSHSLLVFDCAFAPGCCGAPVPGIFASYGEAGGSAICNFLVTQLSGDLSR